jgi:trigger factor
MPEAAPVRYNLIGGHEPLNVTAERIPDSQVVLTIEVDPERVEKSMEQAYRRVAPRVRIPGFRPGKAPRRVVELHLGREALLHEALDRLVPEVVEEAIKAQELDMVATPDLEITSLEPVVIKATVPIRPTVDLGDYRALRVEPEPVEVDEAEVERTLESLRRRYADIEPVERPVQEGDRVRLDITGEVEGRTVLRQEDVEVAVRPDDLATVPGVYERLLGMSKGEEAEFAAVLPEDYARRELAGKPIRYRVRVLEVKSERLPELNDDFARQVGEGFASVAALRERIRADLRARAEEEAKRRLEEKAVAALVEQARLEFPPQLVERELDHLVQDLTRPAAGEGRRALERFLQQVGRSEQELREELRPTATERVKRSLVLSRLAELEGVTVTPEEIEQELASLTGASPQAAQIRQIFDTPSGREVIERQLRSRRTLERLVQIVTGQAPAAAVGEAQAAERAVQTAAGEPTETPEGAAQPASPES